MTPEQIAAAWRDKPIPSTLPQAEHLPYRCLCAVYHGYRDRTIPREEAETIKGFLLRCDTLGLRERVTLLQYVFVNLCGRAGQDDEKASADSKAVAAAFHALTGPKKGGKPHAGSCSFASRTAALTLGFRLRVWIPPHFMI